MLSVVFLLMFIIPAIVLSWRILVSKTRARWLRVGAAAAVMTTLVGAFVVFDDIATFTFRNWREVVGLLAALSGSFYLFGWALRHRSNRRHRTISLIAAVIGIVPALGAIATAVLFQE